ATPTTSQCSQDCPRLSSAHAACARSIALCCSVLIGVLIMQGDFKLSCPTDLVNRPTNIYISIISTSTKATVQTGAHGHALTSATAVLALWRPHVGAMGGFARKAISVKRFGSHRDAWQ